MRSTTAGAAPLSVGISNHSAHPTHALLSIRDLFDDPEYLHDRAPLVVLDAHKHVSMQNLIATKAVQNDEGALTACPILKVALAAVAVHDSAQLLPGFVEIHKGNLLPVFELTHPT